MSITSIATSALLSYQRSLNVVSNNIANVNTEGYSRQDVTFETRNSTQIGDQFIGAGVNVSEVRRFADEFSNSRVRESLSDKAQFETFSQQALQIDRILTQDGTSISKAMQNFYSSLDQVNESPDSIASRTTFIEQANFMVNQFNGLQNQLKSFQTNATQQISDVVESINSISAGIATLNDRIAKVVGEPPELMDRRDVLINELAKLTNVTYTEQSDGALNVFIGNGQAVVNGARASVLSSGPAPSGVGTDISLVTGAGQSSVIGNMKGGQLQGLLDYEFGVVNTSRQIIGQMAVGLAETFNNQSALGFDLNDNFGGNMFTDFNDPILAGNRVTPFGTNAGLSVLSVDIANVAEMQASDYSVLVGAGNTVSITRISDNTAVVTGLALPQTFDGFTLNSTGALVQGDQYTLTPLTDAAENLTLEITDPLEIALAAPMRGDTLLANTGSGQIEIGAITNASLTDPEFLDNFSITIDSVDNTNGTFTYTLTDLSDGTGSAGPLGPQNLDSPFTFAGYPVTISGQPNRGDSFSVVRNDGASGDNRNGLLLSSFQTEKSFINNGNGDPTQSVFDRYSSLITEVGGQTFQANLRFETADVVYEQALAQQQSIAGVNLDEEAANLLQLQQAYQAAGQLVSVSNKMIDILFDSL